MGHADQVLLAIVSGAGVAVAAGLFRFAYVLGQLGAALTAIDERVERLEDYHDGATLEQIRKRRRSTP